MELRQAIGSNETKTLSTQALRETFVLENLFTPGQIQLTYWEVDRTIVGSAVPSKSPLTLEVSGELAADYFCQRREIGVLNIGAPGTIHVDGTAYPLGTQDCLYIGRGSQSVSFESEDGQNPAKFYLMSYPAHAEYPTTLVKQADANQVHLGSQETANERTIFQYIHEKGAKSCQLVMGLTKLKTGSVWNTMPAHTHARRSEVYLYFGVSDEAAVFHFMGQPQETRHVLMHNEQVVLSPSWSIHSGCGTQSYTFIWAMGGENQRFDDMDGIAIRDLR